MKRETYPVILMPRRGPWRLLLLLLFSLALQGVLLLLLLLSLQCVVVLAVVAIGHLLLVVGGEVSARRGVWLGGAPW